MLHHAITEMNPLITLHASNGRGGIVNETVADGACGDASILHVLISVVVAVITSTLAQAAGKGKYGRRLIILVVIHSLLVGEIFGTEAALFQQFPLTLQGHLLLAFQLLVTLLGLSVAQLLPRIVQLVLESGIQLGSRLERSNDVLLKVGRAVAINDFRCVTLIQRGGAHVGAPVLAKTGMEFVRLAVAAARGTNIVGTLGVGHHELALGAARGCLLLATDAGVHVVVVVVVVVHDE